MVDGPTLYGLALLGTGLPAAGLVSVLWDRRDKPGGRWLILTIVGLSGWSASWGIALLVDGTGVTAAALNVVLWFVSLAVVGWVALVVEFSYQERYPIRYVSVLLLVPALTQLLAWTNPFHGLMWNRGDLAAASTFADVLAATGPWFTVHTGYAFLLMLLAGLLLLADLFRLDGLYRAQVGILLAGWLLPLSTSVVFTLKLIPLDYLNPTPIGFLVGAAIWGWGLYRFRLFELVPVARRHVLEQMEEAVLILDDRNVVADANRSATELFDLGANPTGEPVEELLGSFPAVLDAIETGRDDSVVISRDGERRYLTVSRSPIGTKNGANGSILVFEDVTELERHERELDLLKQVFARVFRHDISNDLNVIRAHAELLQNEVSGPGVEYGETILRTCDDLLETSKKARAIEKLVDADRDRYEVDVAHEVRETVEWARDRYPTADVETALPGTAWVLADSQVQLAIRSLVENAIVHNDADEPWVKVTVSRNGPGVSVTVADDGPGLAPSERTVFKRRRVDPLSHSSGLGLWTVHWVMRNSGGSVDIDVTDRGTEVTLTFDRSADARELRGGALT